MDNSHSYFDNNSYAAEKQQQKNNPKIETEFRALHEGDIIEITNHYGSQEYMVYVGQVGSKQNVVYATYNDSQTQNPPQPPSRMSQWLTGYTKTEDLLFSKKSENSKNDEIQRITIRQGAAEEIIGNRSIKKNNFENVNLEPNHPKAIVDRAMFKVLDAKSSPHFQNSKDWVIWCRYGKDIITREMRVTSYLGLACGSGKY